MGEDSNKEARPSIDSDVRSHGLNRTSSSAASHSRRLSSNGGSDPSRPSRNQQPSQARSFEFVLVTDNESRRQVRRHAMRQYMHQRRLDSIARLGTSRVPVGGWTTRNAPDGPVSDEPRKTQDEHDGLVEPDDQGTVVKNEDQPSQPEEKGLAQSGKSKTTDVKSEDGIPSNSFSGLVPFDPRACPEPGGIRDPFESYPIQIRSTDHQLIQHFVVTYPSMMYKFVDSVANNPMLEIFRQFALHDKLPFQAMLAIASKHRAGVEGKKESVQSLTHKMRALQLMNERIQIDSKGQHDGTIYAVATMAVIEDASIERMHFRGLASMIRNRGGMRGMRSSSPFLEKVLYCPPSGFDFIVPDLHFAVPHNSAATEGTESLCDQLRACEDFLRFFRSLYELENTALNSYTATTLEDGHPREKQFFPGTKLYSILTMLPDYDHGIRDIRFIDEYTGMSCLFFLAIVLYDCYTSSSNFDHYLDWLSMEVTKLNPYSNPSITSILWLFLNNGGYPVDHISDSGDRCWVVSRMVRISKRLEWKRHGTIWDRIRQILIDFILTQQVCALGGSNSVDEEALAARHQKRSRPPEYFWNEDEMREDILDIKIPGGLTPFSNTNIPILT
ncbi:hypothetical protein FE257_009809 [Aspergillus nanangensis]|uniref:Uncharacterized protein n=1 Tax=Aspergillus nanangensis TaxID=2582783 RepID=A0AAD4CJJ0_ASPNN|nr:hypothetical protein FE257_009809 [Aspergillus nanangensis]